MCQIAQRAPFSIAFSMPSRCWGADPRRSCLPHLHRRRNRVLGAILLARGPPAGAAANRTDIPILNPAPGWELTAHIRLSLGAHACGSAGGVTALCWCFSIDGSHSGASSHPAECPARRSTPSRKVMFRLRRAGFALLTLPLFHGLRLVTTLFTTASDVTNVLSLSAVDVFGVLLIGRIRFVWRAGALRVGWTLTASACCRCLFLFEVRSRSMCRSALGLGPSMPANDLPVRSSYQCHTPLRTALRRVVGLLIARIFCGNRYGRS